MDLFRLWPWAAKDAEPEPQDDLQEDEAGDQDQEERDKRHAFLVLFFAFLRNDTLSRVDQLTAWLGDGTLDSDGWAAYFRELLTGAHAEASVVGRRLAGHVGPIDADDLSTGAAAWADQEEFFAGFLSDLENRDARYVDADGTLNQKAFNRRARQYVNALRGTAKEAFRVAMGPDVLRWVLGVGDHCKPSTKYAYDCPSLSEEEPKPADQWPTSPGGMATPCGSNCTCDFESVDGKYSTKGI